MVQRKRGHPGGCERGEQSRSSVNRLFLSYTRLPSFSHLPFHIAKNGGGHLVFAPLQQRYDATVFSGGWHIFLLSLHYLQIEKSEAIRIEIEGESNEIAQLIECVIVFEPITP
jgi:hypothetical protein